MNGIILYLPSNNYYSFHGGQNGENVATTVGAKKPFLHKTRSQFTVQPKKLCELSPFTSRMWTGEQVNQKVDLIHSTLYEYEMWPSITKDNSKYARFRRAKTTSRLN